MVLSKRHEYGHPLRSTNFTLRLVTENQKNKLEEPLRAKAFACVAGVFNV